MIPSANPILPSTDLERTADFYGALGFETISHHRQEYLILRRDLCELHFWFNPGLAPHLAGGAYVRFESASDVRSLHQSWETVGDAHRIGTLEETDYGLTEFALHDPDNNQIRVGGS